MVFQLSTDTHENHYYRNKSYTVRKALAFIYMALIIHIFDRALSYKKVIISNMQWSNAS